MNSKVNDKPLDKLTRRKILEEQRKIKPGECLKYVRVLIDPAFVVGKESSEVIPALIKLGVTYKIRSQIIPNVILWEGVQEENIIASSSSASNFLQNFIIHMISGEECIKAMKEKTFGNLVTNFNDVYKGMKLTLLIYGLKQFCKLNKPKITRLEIEEALTEIQILYGCVHRLLETPEELALTISQFTKAIAEIPFKEQQSKKFAIANCFLLNDNRDCVRVEGNAGLSRLWQQHLTRLPLTTIETAQAIMDAYPTPRSLFEAYEKSPDPENVLANLNVRRAGGVLTSVRRIGPELSRKIYNLYTSLDPNEDL